MIDLKAPTVIRGFRTQGVRRADGRLGYPTAIRLLYSNERSDMMQEFRNIDGSPIEFRVLDGASMSVMNLPTPLEARYLRLNLVNFTSNPCMRLELMGCQKQTCDDENECLDNNGGCAQKCLNDPGNFKCDCNVGFQLFTEDGTSDYFIPPSETGERDGDTYRLNKTCVRKMCPALETPENGRILTDMDTYRFGDMMRFMCDFGYIMSGNPSLLCTSAGTWNGTIPECLPASCNSLTDNEAEGLTVYRDDPDSLQIDFADNVTLSCDQLGKPMRRTASSGFR